MVSPILGLALLTVLVTASSACCGVSLALAVLVTASASETPQQAELAVTKTVNNASPNIGDTITFTVTLSDLAPNAASNVVVHYPLPAGPAPASTAPNVGDIITFTVQVSDLGPSSATNVQVSDLLPAGLSLVSSTPSQGSYNGGTGVWTVGTLATATPQTLQIVARVTSANAQTNTAAVSRADQFDPNSANNSASAGETPEQADLAITKTV